MLETPTRDVPPQTRAAAPPLRRVPVRPRGLIARLRLGLREIRQALWLALKRGARGLRAAWWRLRARWRIRRQGEPICLCLGSGDAPIPGWLNVDIDGRPDLRLDLRHRLPLRDGSVKTIYSEHLIEHFTLEHGLALLRECRRVLRDDGVLRVATPDLDALVEAYLGAWEDQDWVQWPCHSWIDTRTRMLNQAFYGWGHRHLYCADELEQRLLEAGFVETRRCDIGRSDHPELAGLETRQDSRLIYEAWGTSPKANP